MMFANTAYEAFYQLLGLQLQETVIQWITSQVIFRALILIIFATSFLVFLIHFASKYMPFFVMSRRAPLSQPFNLTLGLIIGISLLKVDANVGSENMQGSSWAKNPYIQSKDSSFKEQYRVSFIFKLLSSSADEIGRSMGQMIDTAFSKTNSQMSAPNYFYKAILGAATDTLDDPALKATLDNFTEQCLSKVLPQYNPSTDNKFLDRYFSLDNAGDQKLRQIQLDPATGPWSNCLGLKQYVNQTLREYAHTHSTFFQNVMAEGSAYDKFYRGFGANYDNWVASSLLVNHYLDQHEGSLGIEKGTELPGTGGRIFQYLNRIFSMDGILSVFGSRDLKGASLAASRSLEFSDHLARAPHVAGFLKLLLIAFFPVLVFFLAAGKWKPLAWWWFTYLSICLWNPLWALLYHVMTTLSLNQEVLESFGKLTDGFSLYAASLISSRLYQTFAVYSYLQLVIGPIFTGFLLWNLKPLLSDTQPDTLPDGVSTAAGVAGKAAGGLL